MASSTTRRPSWRTVPPVLAVAVFGLAACSNSQESSDVKGTTPPVWTGSSGPAATGEEHGQGADSGKPHADATAELKNASGSSVGTATFTEEPGHLVVTVEASGLQPGFHGLHLHQVGKCEPNSTAPSGGPAGDFLSAGGHLQVGGNDAHPASGDLTSLQVRSDGSAKLVTTTSSVSLDQIKGKALIIHAGADNFGNIPDRYQREGGAGPDATTLSTGDAGGRVACGVVQ
ncbi:superoxide dismutase[Cu-Zn] [Nocardia higoensis]|uniref:superoxide dismutase[Cu-Zn] n=1 Tax=Nocardia higoensis TaxID=228599 RepID=UPI000592593F|nr:superoxide dismutase family protein [Nocardia higoensis]